MLQCVWCNHMLYVWFVTTNNVFSFVCLAICDSDRHAVTVCSSSVSRSCVKRWLRYTCSVRHHELDVIYAPGRQDSPFEIRGLLHQNFDVRNQDWVAVDDSTQTIMTGSGDYVCRSCINGWLWDTLQIRHRNLHPTLFCSRQKSKVGCGMRFRS